MTLRGFVWKSGMRNKRRTILTMLCVALTLFVLSTLVTFVNELDRRLDETSAHRMVTHNAVVWIYPIPERYLAQIEKVPGVAAVTSLTFYGGTYIDRAHTDFAQFSCDARSLFDVFPELSISAEEKQAFIQDPAGAVVGRRKAEKHGWKIGDRISLQGSIMPVDMDLTVRGIFSGTDQDEANVYFHHSYLDDVVEAERGMKGGLGEVLTYYTRATSAEIVPRVSRDIDALFQNTDKPTRTETEKAFQMSFVSLLGNIKHLIAIISGLLLFTILLVTANTMAMSVRERTREIAVLKSLGFRRRKVLVMLMSEGILITVAGGLVGCLASAVLFGVVDLAPFTQGRFQYLDVSWGIIGFGLLVAAMVGLVSTGIPSYRATNITVAAGLRRVG